MAWAGVIAGGIGLAGSMYAANRSKKASKKAAELEQQASQETLAVQRQAYEEGRAALAPYARQEQAASSQMMRQLGLAPPAGPGAAAGGGWGFGQAPAGQAPADISMNQFLNDLITEQIAIAGRAGYGSNSKPDKAIAQGSRMAISAIRRLQKEGKLPADFQIPTQSELNQLGADAVQSQGGLKALRRNWNPEAGKSGYGAYESIADRYFPGGEMMQPGGPGGLVGEGEFIPAGEGAMGGTGPGGAFTAGDIMGLAGVEQLPQEIQDRYLADLMEDPRTDPELAAYLGLTDESLQVGDAYQATPAYAAAMDAGVEAVDASAAAGGGLYSGRRGRALRDVGQQVEQQYYFDAMNRRAEMMGARRGERTSGILRRGAEYGAERGREQSYYNNYMQMLNALSSPTTTTNIAQMGTSLGRDVGANLLGTARSIGELKLGAAADQGAMIADVGSGLMKLAESYI